jgi:hypothetical protein
MFFDLSEFLHVLNFISPVFLMGFWVGWVKWNGWLVWVLDLYKSTNGVSEVFSGHAGVHFRFFTKINFFLFDNSGIKGNSSSGINVITSTHNGLNTSSSALFN